MNNIQSLLETLGKEEQTIQRKRKALLELQPKLEGFGYDLSLSFGGYGDYSTIDFDYPGRNQVIDLITHMKAGKWDKEVSASEGRMDYKNKTLISMPLRIYAAEPPPSCKIVEVPVEIPATPARTVMRKTIVCKEHLLTPAV